MVEIKLDTDDCMKVENDHYVSVRIGDAQKLAKMAPSRTYRFPSSTVGNRKYGKIEVFRRVASSILCIDPTSSVANNEVELALGDLRLRFDTKVGFTEAGKAPQPQPVAPAAPPKGNKVAAAEYLQKHHLEAKLSEAMAAVLRERPADPAVFMAQKLAGNARFGVAKPPPSNELNLPFPFYYRKHCKQASSSRLYSGFRSRAAAAPQPGGSQLTAVPFPTYYRTYFQEARSSGLYAGFKAAGVGKPQSAFAAYYSKNFKQSTSPGLYAGFAAKKARGASLDGPFGAYFKEHFSQAPAATLASLHAKFGGPRVVDKPRGASLDGPFGAYFSEHFAQPPAGPCASLYAKFPGPPRPAAAARAVRSYRLPSCGSYHGRRPPQRQWRRPPRIRASST